MRRPRREAGGGEIALMAVITKAMGAFLVLVVIMLPHYSYTLVQNRTAEAAQNQIEQALGKANEISDQLKKGRLTDEEIDKLLKEIENIKKQLAELQILVAALKRELDQAHAEIARLMESTKALEAEVADLKAQLEQLKTYEPPATMAILSWSGCPGAIFDFFVRSDAVGPDGRPQPQVDRTAQPASWTNEKKGNLVFRPSRESGHVYWRTPEFKWDERLYVWIKLLNSINPSYPAEVKTVSARRACPVNVSLETSGGKDRQSMIIEGRYLVGDTNPIALAFRALKRSNGALELLDISPEEMSKLEADLASAKCEGLLCSFKGGGAKNETAPQMLPRFLEFATSHYEISNDTARVLFELAVVENSIGTGELFQFLALFPEKGSSSQVKRRDPKEADLLEFVKARLRDKGAPGGVRKEVIALIDAGKQPVNEVLSALEKLPDRSTALDDTGREQDASADLEKRKTMTPEERERQLRTSLFNEARRIADKSFTAKTLPTNYWSIALVQASGKPKLPESSRPSERTIDEHIAAAGLPDDLSKAIKALLLAGYYALDDFDTDVTVAQSSVEPTNTPKPQPSSP